MTRKPSALEMDTWRSLIGAIKGHAEEVKETAAASQTRRVSAGPLIVARRAVRNITLPENHQFSGSPMSRLLKFVDRWQVMSRAQRVKAADELHTAATLVSLSLAPLGGADLDDDED